MSVTKILIDDFEKKCVLLERILNDDASFYRYCYVEQILMLNWIALRELQQVTSFSITTRVTLWDRKCAQRILESHNDIVRLLEKHYSDPHVE